MSNIGMRVHVVAERENNGRWLATVNEVPGVAAYGGSKAEATKAVLALVDRVTEARERERA
jgi:predicted RNase H-like HicB family nuclease